MGGLAAVHLVTILNSLVRVSGAAKGAALEGKLVQRAAAAKMMGRLKLTRFGPVGRCRNGYGPSAHGDAVFLPPRVDPRHASKAL